ncbi:MAG: TonB-dependent receptor plug domain-containing protein [Chitinophagaceae bacterium]
MNKIILLIGLIAWGQLCKGQKTIILQIKDVATGMPLSDADIKDAATNRFYRSDATGIVRLLADSLHPSTIVHITLVGYVETRDTIHYGSKDTLYLFLKPNERENEAVIVKSTRDSKAISNLPTRVEVLNAEELEEKANMRPGDIRMVLNESTGIQTQQVSATSASSSIRIQGLDGRYTQILKDGFPLFAGFSGGLGLLQTPPLDLQQVEIIKGAASTLYGGGAIAGLVNLISKEPKVQRELRFLMNGTSAKGLDVSAFYGQKFKKHGWTILATHNRSAAYAPHNAIFTAIPKTSRFVFNPKLFLYLDSLTTISVGLNSVFEDRIGGLADYVKNKTAQGYFEKNKTFRVGSHFSVERQLSDDRHLETKNAVNVFDRKITLPNYVFDGRQLSTYSEVNYVVHHNDATNVVGINLYMDRFSERKLTDAFPSRSYAQATIGFFEQYGGRLSDRWKFEAGIRGDYTFDYGFSLLPRMSILYKINRFLTSRLGGGIGYKTPSIFLEDAERVQFHNVLPITTEQNRLEHSFGLNWDINYKTFFLENVKVNVNQLFFYTKIHHPLLLQPYNATSLLQPVNIHGNLQTKGWETNVRLAYSDFAWYIGYTYTDATLHRNGTKTPNPLTAKTRLNNVLMYEAEDKWKIGLEAYYYSRQYLNDGTWGRAFWIFGFMMERTFGKISAFINFENFTDTRQTKYGSIYTGTVNTPTFKDIYAPLDGRVVNGGIKVNL